MNLTQLEKWEKKLAKGKSEFILHDGGILSLVTVGIIVSIIEIIYEFFANSLEFSFFDKSFQVRLFVRFMLAFPLGCLLGWIVWETSEWSYLRAKRKSQ